jgi:hypothetical protein
MKLPPFLAAVSIAALTSGCAGTADTGDVTLALTGQSPSGNVYRLRDAQIALAGADTTIAFSTEDDPDRTALTARVAAGPYALGLETGWRLERVAVDGSATDVEALLLSPNPQSLEVVTDGTTFASLRFRAGAEDVAMGDGDVVVTIDVDDVDAGVEPVIDAPPAEPPGVTITAAPNGTVPYTSYVFEFAFANGEPTCRVDAQAFAPCADGTFYASGLYDGPHTFEVRVEGPGGVAQAARSFTVDTTAPTVQLTSVPTGVTSPVTIGFVTGGGATATLCRIDAGSNVVCSSPWTTAPLAAGSHTVQVMAIDAAGNAAYATGSFTTL